jgi:hypothetical protein
VAGIAHHPAAQIRAADARRDLFAVEPRNIRAERFPLVVEASRSRQRRLGVRRLNPALLNLMRVDVKTLHQSESDIGGFGDEPIVALPVELAERGFELGRSGFGVMGNDEAVVAARSR